MGIAALNYPYFEPIAYSALHDAPPFSLSSFACSAYGFTYSASAGKQTLSNSSAIVSRFPYLQISPCMEATLEDTSRVIRTRIVIGRDTLPSFVFRRRTRRFRSCSCACIVLSFLFCVFGCRRVNTLEAGYCAFALFHVRHRVYAVDYALSVPFPSIYRGDDSPVLVAYGAFVVLPLALSHEVPVQFPSPKTQRWRLTFVQGE